MVLAPTAHWPVPLNSIHGVAAAAISSPMAGCSRVPDHSGRLVDRLDTRPLCEEIGFMIPIQQCNGLAEIVEALKDCLRSGRLSWFEEPLPTASCPVVTGNRLGILATLTPLSSPTARMITMPMIVSLHRSASSSDWITLSTPMIKAPKMVPMILLIPIEACAPNHHCGDDFSSSRWRPWGLLESGASEQACQ